jgi:Tfp pilus assembly protein PilX
MRAAGHLGGSRERGVVLLFSLIILLILTIGSVALVRSMNSSLFSAGNLAFRRDLVNQGELAIANVLTQIAAGTFVSPTTADNPAANYTAEIQPSNTQGVPNAMLSDALFATVGSAANDLGGQTPDVSIRYLIERMCSGAGTSTTTLCVQSSAAPAGGTAPGNGVSPPTATVYRVTVRVSGARSTQVFLQSTFTQPD